MTLIALAGVVTRWVLFAAVLVATGAAVFRLLVLARVAPPGPRPELAHRVASLGGRAAWFAFAAALARAPIMIGELRDPQSSLLPQARALLLETFWGRVWVVQLMAAVVAVLAFRAARSDRRAAWMVALLAAVVLSGTPAFSGHAFGSETYTALAVAADWLHVLGAGAWLGGMFLLLAGIVVAWGAEDSGLAAALVSVFSPLALAGAGLLVTTGVVSAWLHIGAPALLWQSRYGRVLLLKLLAVGGMAVLGFYHWRRAGPTLQSTGNVVPMRRSVRRELMVGGLVILLTAILVATPPPGTE